ncbi:hypothetical protein CA606_01275 [Caulobacter vibrioides]|uniref:Uncharacterized protein n=1 Tax=Caulobacter vibrioides TaxID=155892 RepID=A0A290MRX1_CAUVI|nr:hypothetical protein CA606_01275 [Caulobacter vibrioides]
MQDRLSSPFGGGGPANAGGGALSDGLASCGRRTSRAFCSRQEEAEPFGWPLHRRSAVPLPQRGRRGRN